MEHDARGLTGRDLNRPYERRKDYEEYDSNPEYAKTSNDEEAASGSAVDLDRRETRGHPGILMGSRESLPQRLPRSGMQDGGQSAESLKDHPRVGLREQGDIETEFLGCELVPVRSLLVGREWFA